ncbi:MAG: DNA repair protein RecO [Chitinophagaceae bacterium]
MLKETKGIVLRSIKYGETSLITTIYTTVFGIQSYLVQGVRTSKKKTMSANLYQASTLLDLIVYHSPNKNLQRIKEAKLAYLYTQIPYSMHRNTIAMFLTELIYKTVHEPESNSILFDMLEHYLTKTDQADISDIANIPIQFLLHYIQHLGFGFQNKYSSEFSEINIELGKFCHPDQHSSPYRIDTHIAEILSDFYHEQTTAIALNHTKRQKTLEAALMYLKYHLPQMQHINSLQIFHELLS